ncbi:MAG: cobalamin-binding protein [Chloroflexota bacterium]
MVVKNIVSLIPSATEIVCALGFEAQLVGRSHECDYPITVQQLPPCTEPKFDPHGTSGEINMQVKEILHEALSVYNVHTDLLKQLQPEVIVTQSQCEVCAVSLADVERAACDWLDTSAQIVSLEPNALADVFRDIQRVAQALGVPERGDVFVAQMKQYMAGIEQQSRNIAHQPTVACIEWIDPLMAAGNWMPELVEMAGGVNLFGQAGQHSPWMTWADLQAQDPEVIVLLPCGYDIARACQDVPILTQQPGWAELRAVQQHRVYVTDGNQYFNRPGPRLSDSLEILAEILHPEVFHFGHEGSAWLRL